MKLSKNENERNGMSEQKSGMYRVKRRWQKREKKLAQIKGKQAATLQDITIRNTHAHIHQSAYEFG